VAVTPVTAPETLFDAEPVTLTVSPTRKPSVSHDPRERVRVSPVAPTSANVSVGEPVMVAALVTSATRSSEPSVTTVADSEAITAEMLLPDVPVIVIVSPTTKPSASQDPVARVIVSPVAPTSANVNAGAPVMRAVTRDMLATGSRSGTEARAFTKRSLLVAYALTVLASAAAAVESGTSPQRTIERNSWSWPASASRTVVRSEVEMRGAEPCQVRIVSPVTSVPAAKDAVTLTSGIT
jgi:hypothetical protein